MEEKQMLNHDGYEKDTQRFTHVGQRVRLLEDIGASPLKKGQRGTVRGLDEDDDSAILVEFDGVEVEHWEDDDGVKRPMYESVWSEMLEVIETPKSSAREEARRRRQIAAKVVKIKR